MTTLGLGTRALFTNPFEPAVLDPATMAIGLI
jgi:hypothetical protein